MLLKHPYNIGRIYEKVARTSRGEIHKIYKSAAELPNVQEQYSIARKNTESALLAEDRLNKIKSNLNKAPDEEAVVRALISGVNTNTLSSAQMSKLKELSNLRITSSSTKEEIINLTAEIGGLDELSEQYSTSRYLSNAVRKKSQQEKNEEEVVAEVMRAILSGGTPQSREVVVAPENVIPSDSIQGIALKEIDSKSKFIMHYEQIYEPTDSLRGIYENALEYENLRKVEMASSFATHYKKGNTLRRI